MLAELRITGFALIDHAELALGEGFNALTGATGVGKSLIIDALELLLGGRASPDVVRHGQEQAAVEGVFYIADPEQRAAIAQAAGFDEIDEPEIILHRTIGRNGRNRCRLNSFAVNVGTLKEIGSILVDIHGQHEQQSLLYPNRQRELLDEYGRLAPLREQFAAAFAEYRRKLEYLNELRTNEKQRRTELDFCRFQLAEIEGAALEPGHIEEIQRERALLVNAERIQTRIAAGYEALYESDGSALDRLKAVVRQLDEIAGLDPRLDSVLEACSDAAVKVEEAAFALRDFTDSWEYDPDRLEEIERRLVEISKLQAKYGDTEQEIFDFADGLRARIEELAKAESDLKTIERDIEAAAASAAEIGARLSEARRTAAARLAKAVIGEIKCLGMNKARFECAVRKVETLDDATASGMDDVEFMIQPNPGEPMMSLRRIASGGETSRIMLALKNILAEADRVPLLVFDEIDANVGGRMGRPIGERLAAVARCHQVICITHLPQIASCAQHHLRVDKLMKKGETFTVVEELQGEARLHEIAEMIGGKNKTAATLQQAREMLGG